MSNTKLPTMKTLRMNAKKKSAEEEDAKSLLFNLKELAPHVDRY